jgi:hypothetical protein
MGCLLLGPGVLGLEVGDRVRVLGVAQPLVLVDDLVAVVTADGGTPWCDGGLLRAFGVPGKARAW